MSNTVRDYSKEKLELKRLLKVYGQAKIAKDLSISPKNLNMILSGKKKFISQKIADRINGYDTDRRGTMNDTQSVSKIQGTNNIWFEEVTKIPKNFKPKKQTLKPGEGVWTENLSNAKFINTRSAETKQNIDNVRKDTINRLLKTVDNLWTTIFLLCMFLIICSGVIIRLSYMVRTY
jgi:hypothetical protein